MIINSTNNCNVLFYSFVNDHKLPLQVYKEMNLSTNFEPKRSLFQSPKKSVPPASEKVDVREELRGSTLRHDPGVDLVEPKVFSPHKARKGYVPRRIEVERRKKTYAHLDITDELYRNGVLDHILNSRYSHRNDSMDSISLSIFDNTDFESRSPEFWEELINESAGSGLPARAMMAGKPDDVNSAIEWKACRVIAGNAKANQFEVQWYVEPGRNMFIVEEVTGVTLERLFICFDAEDPVAYCNRLLHAVRRKKAISASIALNLYVDCMPVDNLKPLDSEQVNRILSHALNIESLRQHQTLDTSSLLLQYNLNHMRTLNQLTMIHLLRKQASDVKSANPFSFDPELLAENMNVFPPRNQIRIVSENSFEDKVKAFKFASLWNKLEAIHIMLQIQSENTALDRSTFFFTPEKTMRIEEFVMNQQTSSNAILLTIKDNWVSAVTASVKNNLKDVKKV